MLHEESKVCSGPCGLEKPLNKFPKRKGSKDGHRGQCRVCKAAKRREHYQNNLERYKENSKKYHQENWERILKVKQQWNEKNKHTLHWRFRYCMYHAKTRNIEFHLTEEEFDVITKQPCYYCNEFEEGKTFTGIDRIDNSVGYVLDNCVPSCYVCNRMKLTHTKEFFLKHIRNILEHTGA